MPEVFFETLEVTPFEGNKTMAGVMWHIITLKDGTKARMKLSVADVFVGLTSMMKLEDRYGIVNNITSPKWQGGRMYRSQILNATLPSMPSVTTVLPVLMEMNPHQKKKVLAIETKFENLLVERIPKKK